MVYFILSRRGYDHLVAAGGLPTTPLWVSGGVLSDQELADLHSRGYDISNFHRRIDPEDAEEVAESVDTIRLHHPGQVVWVEFAHTA